MDFSSDLVHVFPLLFPSFSLFHTVSRNIFVLLPHLSQPQPQLYLPLYGVHRSLLGWCSTHRHSLPVPLVSLRQASPPLANSPTSGVQSATEGPCFLPHDYKRSHHESTYQ